MTIYKFEEKPKEDEVLYFPLDGKFTTEHYNATLHYSIKSRYVDLSFAPDHEKPLQIQGLSSADLDELMEFLQAISTKLKGE